MEAESALLGLNDSPVSAAVPDVLEIQYELESKAAKRCHTGYTTNVKCAAIKEPHKWSLLGREGGGWGSTMVRSGKLTVLGCCHEHTKARVTSSPWQRQQLAVWKHPL